VEQQYVDKVSTQRRWDAVYQNMRALDSLFNESQTEGINASIAQFWQDWQDLAAHPELNASREALLGTSQTLLSAIHTVADDMRRMQVQMDEFIAQEVDKANDIIKQIAEVNIQIQTSHVPGQNNANSLYDRRDQLVRELAGYLDVDYVDNGGGEFTVMTKAGHVLVDGVQTYKLAFESPKSAQELTGGSSFDGDVYFEGGDDFEYTLEVVQPGDVALGGTAAQFRVSLDGGKTWMTDDDGNEMHFAARPDEGKMRIGDLNIWFGDKADAGADPRAPSWRATASPSCPRRACTGTRRPPRR
jgi:flagellar hook-associated protein 1 FlgK